MERSALVAGGLVLWGLLLVATTLEPDQRGIGTHTQLGLQPCTIRQVFEIRCPSCGMTTSWAHLVRGHIVASLRANVGGTLLAVLSAVFGVWAVVSGLRGRWSGWSPQLLWASWLLAIVVVVVVIDWTVRLLIEG